MSIFFYTNIINPGKIVKFCCDFKLLEEKCGEYKSKQQIALAIYLSSGRWSHASVRRLLSLSYRVCKQTRGNYIGDFKGLAPQEKGEIVRQRRTYRVFYENSRRGEGFPPHHYLRPRLHFNWNSGHCRFLQPEYVNKVVA